MIKKREVPNILVTGTPGVGKSTLCSLLAFETGLQWREISKIAHEHNFLEEYDKKFNCPILDEDKLLDYLEPLMAAGGNIVEYHSSEFFPERWFDLVIVLRAGTTTLYDRLKSRGYNPTKLEQNITCEIFQTALEEARTSYKPEIVIEFECNTNDQLDEMVVTILGWYEWWKSDGAND